MTFPALVLLALAAPAAFATLLAAGCGLLAAHMGRAHDLIEGDDG